MWRWRVVAVLLGSGALLTPSGASAALPVEGLSQLAGPAACVAEAVPGCLSATPLDGAYGLVVSPDGKHVYVAASNADAILVLARNVKTGALRPVGCVSETGSGGACVDGAGLRAVESVAVSPDGRNVYAAAYSSDSVVAFARDEASGALTELGCLSSSDAGCNQATALDGAEFVAVSPDGLNVYVTTTNADSIAAFSRDPGSGHLTQLGGGLGCVSLTGSAGACNVGVALDSPYALAVSPDGKSVYVAASGSGALLTFARRPDGALQETSCIGQPPCVVGRGLGGAAGVAVSPDGKSVYVASALSDAVASFMRDPLTGSLSQHAGTLGCISQGDLSCRQGAALDVAWAVAVSPDGQSVYVASTWSDAVASFAREPASGLVTQLPETSSCTSEAGVGCADGLGLDGPIHVAVSPDGKNVYVASEESDAVAVFKRALPAGPTMGIGPRVVHLGEGGDVRLRLACPMTATFCTGTVTLRTEGLLLGRSGFGIAGGVARKVRIPLTQVGLALLRRRGAVVAKVSATARDVQGESRTTRATVTVLA